jgi:histidinol phosphatase-like PHP family hydrolase
MYNYNLHTHTLLSDGQLLPSEVAMRYLAAGYKTIAITDHTDYSNIKSMASSILEFCRRWPADLPIKILPGVELTHLPPEQFQPLARYARRLGFKIIIAHGETTLEPVIKDTNRLALLADIDILAHPGLINDADTLLAQKRGIFLEITSRQGHADTNAQVIKQARKFGAKLILNNDSHSPEDIIPPEKLSAIGIQAGLTREELEKIYADVSGFLKKKEGR